MNNKTLEKPITLAREDFIKHIVELCNDSGLPFFVIEDVLKNLLQEIHGASLKQLEEDKRQYAQMTQKSEQ